MMSFTLSRMHSLGNQFLVAENITQAVEMTPDVLHRLSESYSFDQFLLLEKSTAPDIDFHYRIFNVDGSEVGQCGNGARCIMAFIQRKKLSTQSTIRLKTKTTIISVSQHEESLYTVDMGIPQFEPNKIPFLAAAQAEQYDIEVGNKKITCGVVSMGNPHAVLKVSDVTNAPVLEIGKQLNQHPQFPEGVNVGFMQILDHSRILLRVYERGAGETQACGSGACAAVAVGRLWQALGECVNVNFAHPDSSEQKGLRIEWPSLNDALKMTGNAIFIEEKQWSA